MMFEPCVFWFISVFIQSIQNKIFETLSGLMCLPSVFFSKHFALKPKDIFAGLSSLLRVGAAQH